MKPLDPQAAIGRQQLKKLSRFVEARKRNWEFLRQGLADFEEYFEFSLPTHATRWIPPSSPRTESVFEWDGTGCKTDCSWFGFMLRVKPNAPFTHSQLAKHLETKKVGNRMFFGGNLIHQPAFVQLEKDNSTAIRVAGTTPGADGIMNYSLFLGTYPGLTKEMLQYAIIVVRDFTGVYH